MFAFPTLAARSRTAKRSCEREREADVDFFIDLVIIGLSVGMVYALVALGISLIFSGLDIIHFAHGEIYMLGAFIGLIKDNELNVRKVNYFAIKQIDQAARSSNNDLRSLSYFSNLIRNTGTTVNSYDVESFYFLHEPIKIVCNLNAQLTRWCDDQSLRGAILFIY